MTRQNRLLILWIIFGFIFIHSIDAILYFLSNLIIYIELVLNVPFQILKYSYPFIVVVIYLGTVILILRKLNTTSKTEGIYLTKFPVRTFIILSIVGAALPNFTNYFNGALIHEVWDTYIELNELDQKDYLNFFTNKLTTVALNRIVIYISLVVGFIYINKKEIKTIANNGEHS